MIQGNHCAALIGWSHLYDGTVAGTLLVSLETRDLAVALFFFPFRGLRKLDMVYLPTSCQGITSSVPGMI